MAEARDERDEREAIPRRIVQLMRRTQAERRQNEQDMAALRTVDIETGEIEEAKTLGQKELRKKKTYPRSDRIPQSPKELTMFLLTMKDADDFIKLADIAESVEYLDLGLIDHTPEQIREMDDAMSVLKLPPTSLGYKMCNEEFFSLVHLQSVEYSKRSRRYISVVKFDVHVRGDMIKDLAVEFTPQVESQVRSIEFSEYKNMMPMPDGMTADYLAGTFLFTPRGKLWCVNEAYVRDPETGQPVITHGAITSTIVVVSKMPLVLPLEVKVSYSYVRFVQQTDGMASVAMKNRITKTGPFWQNVRTNDMHTYRSETYKI